MSTDPTVTDRDDLMTQDGRPAVVTRRPFQPAPDEDDDPVVAPARPSAAAQQARPEPGPAARPRRVQEFVVPEALPVAISRRPRGAQTVAVNFKLLPEFKQALEDIAAATGATQTEVLESALIHAYGKL